MPFASALPSPRRPAAVLLAASVLAAGGCAVREGPPRSLSAPRVETPSVPPAAARAEPVTAPSPPAVSSPTPAAEPAPAGEQPPVVVALLEESEASRSSGDLEGAVSALERALRIHPREARLWQALAKLRLQQGEAALAEDLARKSSVLAAGNQSLLLENQQLIATARERQGLAPSDPPAGEE